jgi:amino acid adenylation domain-containing protein/non-ribosomal peptide synthase protein (TIGR01720 family)
MQKEISVMENKTSLSEHVIAADQYAREEAYWLNLFSGDLEKTGFPYDFHKPVGIQRSMDSYSFRIAGELFFKIKKLINRSDYRLHFLLVSALTVLLEKYTSQKDIIIGTPVLKQDTDAEFINTVLALRIQVADNMIFKELLLQVRKAVVESTEHQNYPIETLLYQLDMLSPENECLLFDAAILLENIHDKKYLGDIKPNVIFGFHCQGEALEGWISFNRLLYQEETIKCMASHYEQILQVVLSDIDISLSNIDILSHGEKYQLLHQFNSERIEFQENTTLHELVEAQILRSPSCIAAAFEDQVITFRELNERANQLARRLRAAGIGPESIVGIVMERSIELIIGLLGILKAGAAYLPVDYNYPKERIQYMLEDSGVHLLITHEKTAENLYVKEIITPGDEGLSRLDTHNLENQTQPDHLLYVVYTSGSTGKPKGAAVNHRGCVNMVENYHRVFKQENLTRMSQVASPSFDAMGFEVWPCLTAGAELHIVSGETQVDPRRMQQWLIRRQIRTSYQPTVMVELLMDQDWPQEGVELRVVMAAGDKLTRYPTKIYPFTLYNLYGPTESTVWSTWVEVRQREDCHQLPPIGKPIANQQIYIMSPNTTHLQPVGIAGEICIGGEGVARGYLNRPILTAKRFINYKLQITNNSETDESKSQNVFNEKFLRGSRGQFLQKEPPDRRRQKIYRTGDLARWLVDRNIEFIGRIDNQVKIRGFRIELGEIENQLLSHEEVKNAVVLANEDSYGDKYLSAFIVPNAQNTSLVSRLKDYLGMRLPGYMIPLYIVEIDEISLTPNGKVDRKALPQPKAAALGVDYEPPRDDVEEKLVEIWQEVLGIERLGINDNFFERGGDSIKSIQIASRLQKYNLKVEVRDLFLNPTVKQLCSSVKRIDRIIAQDIVEGRVELTPTQHWFFETDFRDKHHFNQSIMLFRESGFDETMLHKVFTKLVEHHDALRMIFPVTEYGIVQENRGLEGKLFDLEIINLADHEDVETAIEKEANNIQGGIDLEEGPLLKLGLFKTSGGDYLLIAAHHLVMDGISWRILLEDFTLGCQQALQGKDISFQLKTDSFQYWAQRLKDFAQSKDILNEVEYWKTIEESNIHPFPKDSNVEKENKALGNSEAISMILDEENTQKLLSEVNWAYGTEINEVLLTALVMAVNQWRNIEKCVINLEGHGREEIMEEIDITRTIGWFTSHYPLLLDISGIKAQDLPCAIKVVKETIRSVGNRGIGYGILRYLTPDDKKNGLQLKRQPDINFNYMGQFGQETDKDGNSEVFEISSMRMGEIISPEFPRDYAIDINGMLIGGKLILSFAYNKDEYKNDTIQELVDGFRSYLEDIIEHCSKKKEKELTPSDLVEGDELSIEEFEDIKEFTESNIQF